MAHESTLDALAEKLAAAADLLKHAENSTGLEDRPQVIRDLFLLQNTVGSAIESAVRAARQESVSWESIARQLDVTKQGAQQRYGAHNLY